MAQRPSDRWVSIGLSVLLHGALLAAVVYGWWAFRQHTRPAPTLAIEGTVVDARSVRGLMRPPQPAASPVQPPPEEPVGPPVPPQTPAEPEGPPPPTPEELAHRQQQEQQAAEQAAEKAAEEKAAAQKAAAEKAAAEKAAARAAAVDQNAALSDLQHSLAAEEHADTVRSSGALASWQAAIAAKITRAWLRPPTARAGIDCMLNVTQVPGGEVTEVSVGQCNGDQAVRESIEAAVYRASPLPPPPDPSLFDRNLQIRFKPD